MLTSELFLARLIGTEEITILRGLDLVNDYRTVKIPKRRGGWRTIHIPPPLLKEIQTMLLRHFFKKVWPFYQPVYGIQGGTSHVDHARVHQKSRWFFQFDIKDAFPGTDIQEMRKIILNRLEGEMEEHFFIYNKIKEEEREFLLGEEEYARLVLEEKALLQKSIFSPIEIGQLLEFREKDGLDKLTELIVELTTFKGVVPQGAPTSPYLFYLFLLMGGLVNEIIRICDGRYLFSAYVDNFVISSEKEIPEKVRRRIFQAVTDSGLEINRKKTQYQDIRHGSPLITGVSINREKEIVLPQKKVKMIRGLIYRAISNLDLRPRAMGMVASIMPIYPKVAPSQIREPYNKLLLKMGEEKADMW